MGRLRTAPASTERSTNLEVIVSGSPSLDEMESVLADAAADLGMAFSHITRLGTKRYPGNRHWHLKRSPDERGCLDVTYWPEGHAMWVTIRHSEPEWVHDGGRALKPAIEHRLTASS